MPGTRNLLWMPLFASLLVAGCGTPPAVDAVQAALITTTGPTSCGHAGEPCCPANGQDHYACNGDGSDTDYYSLQCNQGMCERCGMPGLKCCTLNKLYCRGDDPSNQKYICRNNVCAYASNPPAKLTCGGKLTTSTATTWTVPIRYADSKCGDVAKAFANSLEEAQACVKRVTNVEVVSGQLSDYLFAQISKAVADKCDDQTISAYSPTDAQACANSLCQNDSCAEKPGTCKAYGLLAGLPAPACSAFWTCTGANGATTDANFTCPTEPVGAHYQLTRYDATNGFVDVPTRVTYTGGSLSAGPTALDELGYQPSSTETSLLYQVCLVRTSDGARTCGRPITVSETAACTCIPSTCEDTHACNTTVPDGCGGTISCGGCSDGVCNANQCQTSGPGRGDDPTCTPAMARHGGCT
jgi:hypothetical protein